MTSTTVKTKDSEFIPPDKMTINEMADELFLSKNQIIHERKKILLESISFLVISKENIKDWLDFFTLCQSHGYLPVEIFAKINETVSLIEDSSVLDPILVQICNNRHLPIRIQKAACTKSKINHNN